jgi:hypothetical protein
MHDESDSESIAHVGSSYGGRKATPLLPRWTTLGCEEDLEVDELAGEDEDESWDSAARAHAHSHLHASHRMTETSMPPPPKKKLFGFESQASGTPGWSSHTSRTPR